MYGGIFACASSPPVDCEALYIVVPGTFNVKLAVPESDLRQEASVWEWFGIWAVVSVTFSYPPCLFKELNVPELCSPTGTLPLKSGRLKLVVAPPKLVLIKANKAGLICPYGLSITNKPARRSISSNIHLDNPNRSHIFSWCRFYCFSNLSPRKERYQ